MSNKMPIKWHVDNLHNFYIALEKKREELYQLQEKVDSMYKEYMFRLYQIREAENANIKEFDSSRFRVKK